MLETPTRDFGPVRYLAEEVFDFPLGLPGFPESRRFLTIRPRPGEALVVLQSLDRVDLAFLALPVDTIDPSYRPRVVEQDRQVLGGTPADWRVLALLSLPGDGPATVNLLGPVILNLAARRGAQAIRDDLRYGAAEPLERLLESRQEALCS